MIRSDGKSDRCPFQAAELEYERTPASVAKAIDNGLRAASQRGIIYAEQSLVIADCRTIADLSPRPAEEGAAERGRPQVDHHPRVGVLRSTVSLGSLRDQPRVSLSRSRWIMSSHSMEAHKAQ